MRYSPAPPYCLLASNSISFVDMQRMARFAKYWDLVANSGRYPASLRLLLAGHSFERFMAFSDWCYDRNLNTFGVKPNNMMDVLYEAFKCLSVAGEDEVKFAISADYQHYDGPAPHCLSQKPKLRRSPRKSSYNTKSSRQTRHQLVSSD
jgi:hypothetical protein